MPGRDSNKDQATGFLALAVHFLVPNPVGKLALALAGEAKAWRHRLRSHIVVPTLEFVVV
ncbi:hypothetical protein BDQ12DRAFT_692509, partial [Crucibulum laeve]